ncbi:MAG: MOSC domain-containing protein [Sagittula sp.]|uniref:MOSC domain-containing protein n=1 Tax=unclassified Sagittula TaxID=2624628 RepID=UPI000C2D23BE|nr:MULTISPECIES: MOSC domain-containing protein [unclassified Sagittula]AUC54113.1 sulfurase [Sagittula sp. P11]WHZ34518.1 MOSC domain-containing protein [Sagittula sp. MA-2]
MPALKPTKWTAEVIWLGIVTSMDRKALMAEPVEAVDLTFAGMAGSVHGGQTRESCSRVTSQYPRGTQILNERQLSIVSAEELDQIAAAMGVETVNPARLGASMVIRGIPDFTFVPPSSRLQATSGATMVVDMENRPCQQPARSLMQEIGDAAKGFRKASDGRRGVTAFVAREGRVAVGDKLVLHVPDQRAWRGEA